MVLVQERERKDERKREIDERKTRKGFWRALSNDRLRRRPFDRRRYSREHICSHMLLHAHAAHVLRMPLARRVTTSYKRRVASYTCTASICSQSHGMNPERATV